MKAEHLDVQPSITNMDDEHYLRAGKGTQTECSCGKSFGLYSDATQHIQWQLSTQTLLANKIKEAELRGRIKQLHDLRSAVLQAENPDDPTSLGVLTYVKLELKDLEAQL